MQCPHAELTFLPSTRPRRCRPWPRRGLLQPGSQLAWHGQGPCALVCRPCTPSRSCGLWDGVALEHVWRCPVRQLSLGSPSVSRFPEARGTGSRSTIPDTCPSTALRVSLAGARAGPRPRRHAGHEPCVQYTQACTPGLIRTGAATTWATPAHKIAARRTSVNSCLTDRSARAGHCASPSRQGLGCQNSLRSLITSHQSMVAGNIQAFCSNTFVVPQFRQCAGAAVGPFRPNLFSCMQIHFM